MKKFIIAVSVVLIFYSATAQNIAITDDNGYTADPSAMLDVNSIDKGMLVPRVTSAQRAAISSPAAGLLVFDSTVGSFYFYTGTGWMSLSNSGEIWTKSGNDVFTTDINDKVGVGTNAPVGKLEVKADASIGSEEPIFEVLNAGGDTVFAVYPGGVRIFVDDNPTKATGNRGGFAIGGFSGAKGFTNEYLRVSPDSVRIYIDENSAAKASGSRGGFAVGGFSSAKVLPTDYFNISGADSAEIINPAEARILWYPAKEAFFAGKVLIESVDSVGTNSIAFGNQSKAIGDYSQAFGDSARAFGLNSTAIGNYANAVGDNSYAFGNNAMADDTASYAIGTGARAIGLRSFAVGSQGIDLFSLNSGPTIASGDYSYAFGMGSITTGQGAFAFGTKDTASGQYSTAIGYQCISTGQVATSIGSRAKALGDASTAMGDGTTASGQSSTAMGTGSIASEYASIAAGNWAQASGSGSVAMGSNVIASGHNGSVALGYLTRATGGSSVAMGSTTQANGDNSTAIGGYTIANGYGSTALGSDIIVEGSRSFGIGLDNPWPSSWTITQDNTMSIMGGNVGIGTVDPNVLFHVAGDARVEGDLFYGGGFTPYNKPDFVFKKGYEKDFDILEVDQFIRKNKHLPWVTAAKDEEKGINLTRMSFETLEAVENMQLQIIQLKKENIEKEKQIDQLNKRIEKLETLIEK